MKIFSYKNYSSDDVSEIYFRQSPSSDLAVINQILNQKVYSLEGWAHKEIFENYRLNKFKDKKPLIIDAGANIGASSIYFSDTYQDSLTISVEPEKNNYTLLRLNTIEKSIISLEGAVGSETGSLYLTDPGYGDVGFRVSNSGNYKVPVYSISDIINMGLEHNASPFICKIDIEGGESELFSKNVEWIESFALIIIELHDWMLPMQGSSKPFFESMAKFDFEMLHKGENLFFFNRKLLSHP